MKSPFSSCFKGYRQFKITLAERRMLQLTACVFVTLWRIDRCGRLYVKMRLSAVSKSICKHAARYYQVVAVLKRNVTHKRAQGTRTTVDEQHLVGISVFVE
jgi:hypothetical protein